MIGKRAMVNLVGVIVLSAGLAGGCATHQTTRTAARPGAEARLSQQGVGAILWVQHAAETRALYYQAYNTARLMLDQTLARHEGDRPLAVVTDIDETLLDGSPYMALCARDGETYPYHWDEWVDAGAAIALPGALEFLRYADSKGVAVFYVSTRGVDELPGTLRNLQRVGFPQAVAEHVLLKRPDEKGKESRRRDVARTHEIALLIGDNLNDFSDVFEGQPLEARKDRVDDRQQDFGRRFIVVPNPMYGDWEGALYNYDWSLSPAEKLRRRLELLRAWTGK